MKYPNLIRHNKRLNNVRFEFDCGDLWLRENVEYQDDQMHCWNMTHDFFYNLQKKMESSISNFLIIMNYTLPEEEQLPYLKKNKKYKISKKNKYFYEPIKFSKNKLHIDMDFILFMDPLIISGLINSLKNLKKINIFKSLIIQNNFAENLDNYIKINLQNPSWKTWVFNAKDKRQIKLVKLIKSYIDPEIKFEFDDFDNDSKDIKILRANRIL